jgi:hypothetical protein
MTNRPLLPSDPDLRGVPAALLRAAENARRLAGQTGTPFVTRQPGDPDAVTDTSGTVRVTRVPNIPEDQP